MNSHLLNDEPMSSIITINNQETLKFEPNNVQKNDKPLSLILSLKINDRFLLKEKHQNNHRSNFEILSTTDDTKSIKDFNRINNHFINTNYKNQSIISLNNNTHESSFTTTNDRFQPAQIKFHSTQSLSESISITNDHNTSNDIFIDEIFLAENYKQDSNKFNDLNNLCPLETSLNDIDNTEQPIKMTANNIHSLRLSLSRKPNTLYKVSDINSHQLSNNNHSIISSINERNLLDESISNLQDISSNKLLETSFIDQIISSNNSTKLSRTIPLLISTMLKNHYTSQQIDSQISDKSSTTLNLTEDEIIILNNLSEAINKIIQKEYTTNFPLNIEMEDSIPISAKQLEITERRKQRYKLQREIITIAKKALKPAFKKHDVTKEEYKKIMKKVVTKAMYSHKVNHKSIGKMIDAYVKKYQSSHRHHSNSLT
ncbi:unnamed protein product [Rotaria sp. Silwood1]|nr:unnamed protein product [Rotaria sp. Silwood1]